MEIQDKQVFKLILLKKVEIYVRNFPAYFYGNLIFNIILATLFIFFGVIFFLQIVPILNPSMFVNPIFYFVLLGVFVLSIFFVQVIRFRSIFGFMFGFLNLKSKCDQEVMNASRWFVDSMVPKKNNYGLLSLMFYVGNIFTVPWKGFLRNIRILRNIKAGKYRFSIDDHELDNAVEFLEDLPIEKAEVERMKISLSFGKLIEVMEGARIIVCEKEVYEMDLVFNRNVEELIEKSKQVDLRTIEERAEIIFS